MFFAKKRIFHRVAKCESFGSLVNLARPKSDILQHDEKANLFVATELKRAKRYCDCRKTIDEIKSEKAYGQCMDMNRRLDSE